MRVLAHVLKQRFVLAAVSFELSRLVVRCGILYAAKEVLIFLSDSFLLLEAGERNVVATKRLVSQRGPLLDLRVYG